MPGKFTIWAMAGRGAILLTALIALSAGAVAAAQDGRRVLVLDYTAVSCGPCAVAAGALERLKGEAGDSVSVVCVHYYDSFKIPEAESLAALYTVVGTPTVWFDGSIEELYGDTLTYARYRLAFEKSAALPPAVGLSLNGWYDSPSRAGQADCVISNPQSDTVQGILRVALVEGARYHSWGGGDSLYDILRDVVPSFSGSALLIPPKGDTAVSFPFQADTSWNEGRMALVAWVQETNPGRGVLQSAKRELGSFMGINYGRPSFTILHRPSLGVYPNPCAGRATISYDLPRAARVSLKVYNMNGQLVETLEDGLQETGQHTIEWRTDGGQRTISNGVFFIRANLGGQSLTTRMMVIR